MNPTHIIYFTILSLFWGGSFLGIHYVVSGLPSSFGALCRVLVAFVLVTLLMLARKRGAKTSLSIKLQAIGAGVLNMGVSWILLFYGEKFISPALASIYNSTSTIFAAIFAPFILGALVSKKNWAGVVVGFLGILMVFGPHVKADDIMQIKGQLAIIAMSVCYGAGVAWVKRFSGKIRTTRNLFYQCLGGLIVLGAHTAMFERPWGLDLAAVPYSAWIAILYLGVCSTFISWLLYIRLIRDIGAVRAISVTYAMPIVSIILDIVILGRVVRLTDIIGVVIILAGVYLIQKTSKRDGNCIATAVGHCEE